MLKERQRLFSGVHRILEGGVAFASIPAAYHLRLVLGTQYSDWAELYPLKDYATVAVAAGVAWIIAAHTAGLYRSFRTRGLGHEVSGFIKASILATVLIFAAVAMFRQPHVSRSVVGLSILVAMGGIIALRLLIRGLLRAWRRKGLNFRELVIIGTGGRARAFARVALNNSHWGIRPIGFVTPREGSRLEEIEGLPILGTVKDLGKILTSQPVDEVIVAVPPNTLTRIQNILLVCGKLGIRTQIAMNFAPPTLRRFMIDDFGGVPTLSIMGPRPGEVRAFVQRTLDLVGSAFLLLLGAPFLAALAIVIRIFDGPGVLFKQVRCGRYGREFMLYKFRTMVHGADQLQNDLLAKNEMTGPVFKMRNDPRVTRLGRVLRRTSLDELPQLFNVLKGDMSLVGPRPPLPSEVEEYSLAHRRRLAVRPGLTGLWQVSGRNDISDFEEWMDLDLKYVDGQNFSKDFRILLKTIPAVLRGRGAS